jgi:TonB family protein
LLPKRPLHGTALPVRIKETKVNERTLLCLEQPKRYFCVEPSTGALAYRVFGSRELEFRDYKLFRGKSVPTSFRAYTANELTMEGTFKWSELETSPETLRLPEAAEWREYSDSCKADGYKPLRVRISSGVAAQRIIDKVAPRYPIWAKNDRVMGKVILKATIGRDGSVQNLTPISSPREDLTNAAADAVRQWKYLPYFLCDEPVEVETQVEITFTLVG